MNGRADKYFRVHPAAVDDINNGRLVVWRADRSEVFTLNDTGEKVWRRLRTGVSPRQIALELTTISDAGKRTVGNDIDGLIGLLREAGLVESIPGPVTDAVLTPPTSRERAAALHFIGAAIAPACALNMPHRIGSGFWEAVARLAFRYRISGLLQNQLERNGWSETLPNWLHAHLKALQQRSKEHNRMARRQLHEMIAVLNQNGIEPVLLKGSAMLLADTYVDDGDRWMSDIDLLIHPKALDKALVTFSALGFRQGGNPNRDYNAHHHLAPLLRLDRELPVELHRSVLPDGFSSMLPVSDVWKQSVRVHHPTLQFRVPSPTHRLVHAIAHAQLVDRHYPRRTLALKELSDYAWLTHRHFEEIHWPELTTAFAKHIRGLEAFVYTGERLFGVPQPPGFLSGGLAAQLYWWRASYGIRWDNFNVWNERLYRLSENYLREQTGCQPGKRSLARVRVEHIARSLIKRATAVSRRCFGDVH